MGKMGAPLDGIHWFVQLLSAALAYTGDVNKSKISCKLSVAGPVLVSRQGCQQEAKQERPLLWLSTNLLGHESDKSCLSEQETHLPPWPEWGQSPQYPNPQNSFNLKTH